MREFLSRISAVNALFGARQDAESEGLERDEGRLLLESLQKAREQWHAAHATFEVVSERDLVDAAIFTLDAAERRYMYLWRMAKEKGLVAADQPEEAGRREGLRRAWQF